MGTDPGIGRSGSCRGCQLVEDNELNREIAQFILEHTGITVVNAENGKEAVEIFKASEQGEFDFILMDVMMPVMDGLEATRIIRKMERPDAVQIPIFAMTANAFSDDRKRCKEAGMTEHLAKPLNSEKMIAKLRLYYNRKV
ncbi:MAG: response regulator [Clostridium sp.]|jgi:CheY-like chemotaxis protein|nr:response regulator [Enterocloster sp.]MBS4790883.1 response regulator [Clostridium sp.]RHO08362.1 response regulator [Clostridium sp. AM22-11AC]RHQ06557.1 response regulator [Clostridium sp. AM51-4]RHT26181.1 response regulator [Clostridium sp. AM32-2]RHV50261.1 response regulator [Clostridium sp. OM04-12AA]